MRKICPTGFQRILGFCLLITAFCTQAGAETKSSSDPYGFLKSQVEQYGTFEHLKFGTVGFSKLIDRTCPAFTANVDSFTNAFVFHTPTYSSLLYPHVNETTGHSEIIASNKNCRYIFSLDRFVGLGGEQVLLPHKSQSGPQGTNTNVASEIDVKSNTITGQKELPKVVINNGNLTLTKDRASTIDIGGADPDLSGISTAGAFWSNADRTPEYSGIMYCATRSCSLLLDNATEFNVVSGLVDTSSASRYIDVISRNGRLRIDVKRQIFTEKWIDSD